MDPAVRSAFCPAAHARVVTVRKQLPNGPRFSLAAQLVSLSNMAKRLSPKLVSHCRQLIGLRIVLGRLLHLLLRREFVNSGHHVLPSAAKDSRPLPAFGLG
jgi:hypothetical protein